MDEQLICRATRKDGAPCTARALPGKAYCFAHDPEREEALRESREKGGKGKATAARAEKLLPGVLRPVLDQLLATLKGVSGGEVDPRQATATAAVARAIVAVYSAGQLEERIAALEQTQEQQGQRRAG